MRRTRIKFCGMTDGGDVALACELGVDALGFIFATASRRVIAAETARDLVARVPAFVTRVGLFLDAKPEVVRAVLERVDLDCLQFHGSEDAAYCEQFRLPYLKAIAMSGAQDPMASVRAHPNARGFVLDAHVPGGSGGGGVPFDWSRIPAATPASILAGGLSPANVFDAISTVRPWAVDVVSGIESSPGRKSPSLMRHFIHEVRRADDANSAD